MHCLCCTYVSSWHFIAWQVQSLYCGAWGRKFLATASSVHALLPGATKHMWKNGRGIDNAEKRTLVLQALCCCSSLHFVSTPPPPLHSTTYACASTTPLCTETMVATSHPLANKQIKVFPLGGIKVWSFLSLPVADLNKLYT